MENNFYVIFFDLKLDSYGYHYPANVYAIIEELRLNYFKNKSIKISDKTLLIVTEDEIIDTYPNINSWIEDIIIDLSDGKGFIVDEFKEVEWHIFTPDEEKIKEYEKEFADVRLYLNV